MNNTDTVRKLAANAYEAAKRYPPYSPAWQYWTLQAHGLERLLVPGARIWSVPS